MTDSIQTLRSGYHAFVLLLLLTAMAIVATGCWIGDRDPTKNGKDRIVSAVSRGWLE